ncbi:hypothetical protein CTAYLR_004116 [Chrysophaeum taylorii]|uniref:Uncharacterized protein n=1 Tax=Chrysophaeum taylorii TaxID=2483200 RepID=A0AAD7UDN5_9STRA|nr:hypothetical protein CTAYLR_004116 [Chrysophaeum taylorii]
MLLLLLLVGEALQVVVPPRPVQRTVLYGVPPRSPRPSMFYDEQKLEVQLVKKHGPYNDEYDDEIANVTRRLFELRMRQSQRLPVKTHEFKMLRKHIARLKTQKRLDELRALGHDPLKRKPRTRRERRQLREKERLKEIRRANNRERYRLNQLKKQQDAVPFAEVS